MKVIACCFKNIADLQSNKSFRLLFSGNLFSRCHFRSLFPFGTIAVALRAVLFKKALFLV